MMNKWKKITEVIAGKTNKLKVLLPIVPALVVGIVVVTMLFLYQTPTVKEAEPEPEPETIDLSVLKASKQPQEVIEEILPGTFELDNGFYIGTGTGYGGDISVGVEVKDKRLNNIWVISANGEDKPFLSKAKALLQTMIETQSTKVDTVSGATYSSKGIIAAVENALDKKQTTFVNTSTKAVEEKEYTDLKDGTYTGSGTGFGGKIKVEVTILNGAIAGIEILDASGEDPEYLTSASSILQLMIEKQSTNVDVISGATYTSKGLIRAVRRALEKSEDGEEDEELVAGEEGTLEYPDGIYYGTGTGYAGDLTLGIAISNKTLKAAVITKTKDDDSFLTKAKTILEKAVVTQNIELDAVSGATYSSNGILEALGNAMNEAKKAAGEEVEEETKKTLVYRDGTYTVTTDCIPDAQQAFTPYTITMKVKIKEDKITAISDVAGSGELYDSINDGYIDLAVNGNSDTKGMVAKITKKGLPDNIDIVSGATSTSNSILEGCRKALNEAKIIKDTTVTTPIIEDPTVVYKNGEFTGSAVCQPDDKHQFEAYDLGVTVTITDNKITAIHNITGSGSTYVAENDIYTKIAAEGATDKTGVVNQILTNGLTKEVDVISGATCSSKAIAAACKAALESAKQ